MTEYDYIIVGGGTAGSVLAAGPLSYPRGRLGLRRPAALLQAQRECLQPGPEPARDRRPGPGRAGSGNRTAPGGPRVRRRPARAWLPGDNDLSGIGPATHLRALGIPVVADLAGVGWNLQDHPISQGPLRPRRAAAPQPLQPRGNVCRAAQVYGIDGVRVADASVTPLIPDARPNATVPALAERAADLIAHGLSA